MRSLALLTLALLLTACGSASHPSAVTAPSSDAPASSVTTTSPPRPSTTPSKPTPVLLPPACTPADGIRWVKTSADGGGGAMYDDWTVDSRIPCTLDGTPRVTLLDSTGAAVPFDARAWTPPGTTPGPVAVGPHQVTEFAVEKFRCDPMPARPATRAMVRLPGGTAAFWTKLAYPLGLCPAQGGDQVLHVSSLGGWGSGPSPRRYAVPVGASFVGPDTATWEKADVDGDGRPDTVIVEPREHLLQVTLAGSDTPIIAHSPRIDFDSRLQGVTDLAGSGTREILVASTASGVKTGYDYSSWASDLWTLSSGTLHRLPLSLYGDDGRGSQYAGLTCRDGSVTNTSALATGGTGADTTMKVTRTTWRLSGATAAKTGTKVDTEVGDPASYARTTCPGLGTDGWAPGPE